MHLACARRDWSCVKLLIEGRASLEIRDNNKMTPLDVLNLSDIERLKMIAQGLSCDDKSTVKDYDSYVNGQKQIATFCKQTFYTDPNILKDKINQYYNIDSLCVKESVELENSHKQYNKSSDVVGQKLENLRTSFEKM